MEECTHAPHLTPKVKFFPPLFRGLFSLFPGCSITCITKIVLQYLKLPFDPQTNIKRVGDIVIYPTFKVTRVAGIK
jgi:hypothetical protein